MTIDDFDLSEINNLLAVREETHNTYTLEAAHDDGHNDLSIVGCYHNDVTNSPWHDDAQGCNTHDDGHYDIFDDVIHDDAPCPRDRACPE